MLVSFVHSIRFYAFFASFFLVCSLQIHAYTHMRIFRIFSTMKLHEIEIKHGIGSVQTRKQTHTVLCLCQWFIAFDFNIHFLSSRFFFSEKDARWAMRVDLFRTICISQMKMRFKAKSKLSVCVCVTLSRIYSKTEKFSHLH